MISKDILKSLDYRATKVCKPSFSQDTYEIDQILWNLVLNEQPASKLISHSNFDFASVIGGATDQQMKSLYSGVLVSFAPHITASDIREALQKDLLNTQINSQEVTSFINTYLLTVRSVAVERGIAASLIFGLPTDVIELIKTYSSKKILMLSQVLKSEFKLRYSPDLISEIVGMKNNNNSLAKLSAFMNRYQQSLNFNGVSNEPVYF